MQKIRKPSKPKEPKKPERKARKPGNLQKTLEFEQANAPTLLQVIEALPQGVIKDPGAIAVTFIRYAGPEGYGRTRGPLWALVVNYEEEEWKNDEDFRKAFEDYKEKKMPKYKRNKATYDKKLEEWKKAKIEQVRNTY